MKLPQDAVIAEEKIRDYLLVLKSKNDKSRWLASGGYTLDNWQRLQEDIRQLLQNKAQRVRENPWGQLYEIQGVLEGPNGKSLHVCSIWMIESETDQVKFITLYADKRKL